MPFNSNTYRANKAVRESAQFMAQARDIKVRAVSGEAYDWEVARIPDLVRLARINRQMARRWRYIASLAKKEKPCSR